MSTKNPLEKKQIVCMLAKTLDSNADLLNNDMRRGNLRKETLRKLYEKQLLVVTLIKEHKSEN